MSKIYTRTGDSGETSLLGGRRVRKDDLRVQAIGSIDEANASIGLVRVELSRSGIAPDGLDELLSQVQHRLFDIGAELAMPAATTHASLLRDEDTAALEAAIDEADARLPQLKSFILPGGAPAAAQLHMARCVCRRAERRLVELATAETVRAEVHRYTNRLSDLLFVLARLVNHVNRVHDVEWNQRKTDS